MGEKRSYSAVRETDIPTSTHSSNMRTSGAAGQKSDDHSKRTGPEARLPQETSPYMAMFETFRAELDEHHDRRERIIKASRDITAASKKIIFALQRVRALGEPVTSSIRKTADTHALSIASLCKSIQPEFLSINGCRYAHQISPGIQEHVEALLFERYLETQQIMTYREMSEVLAALSCSPALCASQGEAMEIDTTDALKAEGSASAPQTEDGTYEKLEEEEEKGGLVLTPEDYILGLLDMTGEVMRFGITSIATSGEVPSSGGAKRTPPPKHPKTDLDSESDRTGQSGRARTVLDDLQTLRQHLSILSYTIPPHGNDARFIKDLHGKMDVMLASVDKVERALYGLVVRGSERPKGWMPDLSASSSSSSSRPVAASAEVETY